MGGKNLEKLQILWYELGNLLKILEKNVKVQMRFSQKILKMMLKPTQKILKN